jgi:transcriptional regulator with XRE-family HTH domain
VSNVPQTATNLDTIPAEFQARLIHAMDAKGLNPERLSEACGFAFGARAIFRWRRGERAPGVGALPLLCDELGVSADWLLGMSDIGGPPPFRSDYTNEENS